MVRISLDEYYLGVLRLLARRSTCSRRAVAAIVTDENGVLLSTGYNGVPRGAPHCTDSPCLGALDAPGDTKNCMAVHAEVNALIQCPDLTRARNIYVSCTPCFSCAKMICNTTIKRVVCLEPYSDLRAVVLFEQLGVKLEYEQTSAA